MLKYNKGDIIKQRGGKVAYRIGEILQQGKLQMVELIPVSGAMARVTDITYRTVSTVNNSFIKVRTKKVGGK